MLNIGTAINRQELYWDVKSFGQHYYYRYIRLSAHHISLSEHALLYNVKRKMKEELYQNSHSNHDKGFFRTKE